MKSLKIKQKSHPDGKRTLNNWGSTLWGSTLLGHRFWIWSRTYLSFRNNIMERKLGGKFHLKLNIGSRPIANQYHEGRVKKTLKGQLKVPELAKRSQFWMWLVPGPSLCMLLPTFPVLIKMCQGIWVLLVPDALRQRSIFELRGRSVWERKDPT